MNIRSRLVAYLLPLLVVGPLTTVLLNMWLAGVVSDQVEVLEDESQYVIEDARSLSDAIGKKFREELLASYEANANYIRLHVDKEIRSLERVIETTASLPTLGMWFSLRQQDVNFLSHTLRDHFSELLEAGALSEVAILGIDGQEYLRVASQYLPQGGDPILDSVPLRNMRTNEAESTWFKAFAKNGGKMFAYAHVDEDYPVHTTVVSICCQLRTRSNVIGHDLASADGILRISIPLHKIIHSLTTPEDKSEEQTRLRVVDLDNGEIYFDSMDAALIGQQVSSEATVGTVIERRTSILNLRFEMHIDDQVFAVGTSRSDELAQSIVQRTDAAHGIANQLHAKISENNVIVLFVSVLLSLMLTVITVVLSRTLTGPIKQLNKATRLITMGDLQHRIAVTGRDEIAELAADFELMRQRVSDQMQKLTETNNDLEAAMRIKTSFMANMSHEIRTPLNGLLGMADLLYDSELNTNQREQLDIIRSSGQDLLSVINDILDYSKIESGNMDIERVPLNVWDLAEDVVRLFVSKAHKKGLDFNLYIDPRIQYKVLGDAHRIKQVLCNLVSNAIKFTSSGMVFLRVDREMATEESCELTFSVIDTGIGIKKESQNRIFESFNQADLSTTRRFGGTGLGLAISKRLTSLMGGTLKMDGEYGKGSTFQFTLPFVRDIELRHISSDPGFHGKHILCLHLDPLSNKVIDLYARSFGLQCHCCVDEAELREKIEALKQQQETVCAILIDLQVNTQEGIRALFSQWSAHNCIGVDNFERINNEYLKELSIKRVVSKPIRYKKLKSALSPVTRPETSLYQSSGAHQILSAFPDKRILLAEDNLINRKVVCGYLKPMELEVDVAETGTMAVRLFDEGQYDLILMDCHMPDMDGYEATRCIRNLEQEHGTHIPIIALTANAMAGDREKCLSVGMDDYLSKPLKAELLRAMLDKWFSTIES